MAGSVLGDAGALAREAVSASGGEADPPPCVEQVVGAPCFAIAGALFCYEVQSKWWKWKPLSVGWQM